MSKKLSLKQRIEAHFIENQKSLKKYGLKSRLVIRFRNSRNGSIIGRLAVKILNKCKGFIDTEYTLIKK